MPAVFALDQNISWLSTRIAVKPRECTQLQRRPNVLKPFLHLASQITTTATLSKHLTTLIAKMVASGTQKQKKRPYFRIPLEWRNHAITKDMQAVCVRDQAMKAQCVMSMMIVILNDATSVNFLLVAEKRKLIRVSATVTATVNQIFAWVANVSMVGTTIDVIPTTIVNLDVAHMESLLETAKHLPHTVKIAFETMIARLNIACFPLVLTIETVLIARMTTTAWKVLHAFGARLVLRVRKISAALGGIGMSAQKNAPGSKKSRLRATNCSKQFVNKTETLSV